MSKRKKGHKRKAKKYKSGIELPQEVRPAPSLFLGRLTVAVILGVIVAVAAVQGIHSVQVETNVKEMVQLIDILQRACQRYYFDVGAYPMEFSDVGPSQYLARNLTRESGSPSWNGPYITQYLLAMDVPYQATVRIHNYIDSSRGFDLDGNGAIDRRGEGNYADIWYIPENIARLVDRRIDGILLVDDWQKRGSVRYATASGRLSVFLTGGTYVAPKPAQPPDE